MISSGQSSKGKSVAVAEIDLRYYRRVVLNHKYSILAFVAIATLVTFLVVNSMPLLYKAESTILIESHEAKVLSYEDVYDRNDTNAEYYQTQYEILKSRQLAEKVVSMLSLHTNPLFNGEGDSSKIEDWIEQAKTAVGLKNDQPELTEGQRFQQTVRKFQQALSVSRIPSTQLIRISFESRDPELSAQVANTLADVFIENQLEAKLDVAKKATSWLSDRLVGLRDKLMASEARLQAYRDENELIDVNGVQTVDATQLTQLTNRYIVARDERARAETIYNQIQALGSDPDLNQLMSIPSVLKHPLVQQAKQILDNSRRQLNESALVYGPKHPTLIKARTEVASARADLDEQVRRVIAGLKSDYRFAVDNETSIGKLLEASKGEIQGINKSEFRLKDLEHEVEADRILYNNFLVRSKETDQAGGLQAPLARIIDEAIAPSYAYKPAKKLAVIVALLGSTIVAVGFSILNDSIRITLRTEGEVEENLGLKTVSVIPETNLKRLQLPASGLLHAGDPHFRESIRTLKTNLFLRGRSEPDKIVLVTSTVPNEGKSTVSVCIAEELAKFERVLLVEGDFRRPCLATMLETGVSHSESDGFDANTGLIPAINQFIRPVGESGQLQLLSFDAPTAGMSQSFSISELCDHLRSIADRYDRIIIDSSPAGVVSDAVEFAAISNIVLYVIRFDSTASPIVRKSVKALYNVGVQIDGVVLNRTVKEKTDLYDYNFDDYIAGGKVSPIRTKDARSQSSKSGRGSRGTSI